VLTVYEVGSAPCIDAYVARDWDDLVRDLQSKVGSFGHERVLFESVYIGNAQACQPDKQGRILLPQTLRDFAGLGEDVVFVGMGRKFQIFSAEARQKVVDEFRRQLRENPNLFRDLGV
jgi:MraZ protein